MLYYYEMNAITTRLFAYSCSHLQLMQIGYCIKYHYMRFDLIPDIFYISQSFPLYLP